MIYQDQFLTLACNLSFAGLKTAILKSQNKLKTEQEKFDLLHLFKKTVIEILYKV